MSTSRSKKASCKPGDKYAAPSPGPYRIIRMKGYVPHLMSADHTRIAWLDDAHANDAEVAATAELLSASWELLQLVTDFVADIDAVRANAPDYVREEWPDLNDTYNKAALLLGRLANRNSSS